MAVGGNNKGGGRWSNGSIVALVFLLLSILTLFGVVATIGLQILLGGTP